MTELEPILAAYRNRLFLLVACQVPQSIAALTAPALSANVIDQGIGGHDTAHILRMGWLMLAAALTQTLFSLGAAWLGTLVAFLAYITQILISVMMASLLFVMAPRALVSARRIREVLQTPSSVAEPVAPKTLPTGAGNAVAIAFRYLTFAYPWAEKAILHDLSFTVKAGWHSPRNSSRRFQAV